MADKQFEEILTRYEHLLRGDANLNLTPLELPMPLREACAKLEGDCRQARLACSVDDFGFVADISGGYTCEAQMFQNRRTYDWQLRVALTVGGKEYWAQSFNVDCNGEELYHVMKRLLFAAAERKFAGRMEAMLRKRQKAAKLQELGKANVEALAAEVLKGKEKDDMDMKKPKTIVEEYFEAVFRPHDKLEEKSMFYAQSYLDFTPEVGAMMERLGEECRRADLAIDLSKNDLEQTAGAIATTLPVVSVSAVTGEGLDELERAIAAMFPLPSVPAGVILTHARQAEAVKRAAEYMSAALGALEAGRTPDIVLTETEGAMAALGELTGRTVREDVTERIFERFCVGK